MKCRNCGNIQFEEPPQGLKIPPKILYFDIETSLIKANIFTPGRQFVSWKSIEQEPFVICWAAAWMSGRGIKVMSDCVTSSQAKRMDDSKCLRGLYKLIQGADYIVGHNMRNFDFKMVNARFLSHGWDAPHQPIIVDTLLLSRRQYRVASHSMDAWVEKLGGKMKEDMRLKDWKECSRGEQKALDKMHRYCRGDIRRGIQITLAFQKYYEQATGKPLFR